MRGIRKKKRRKLSREREGIKKKAFVEEKTRKET
jgi:hypothetical protein